MKKLLLVLLTVSAVALCADAPLPAPDAPQTNWLAAAGHIAADLLPILSVFLVALGTWALKKLAAKLHLDGIINTNAIVDDAVAKGVNYAEQWAAKQAVKPVGDAKMQAAIGFADTILQNAAVQGYAKEHLEKIAEGLIAQQNAPAATPAAGT